MVTSCGVQDATLLALAGTPISCTDQLQDVVRRILFSDLLSEVLSDEAVYEM